jgi:hypothetical protein
LIVEIDVCHKPLLKTREFLLLLLLRQYDEAICGIPRSVWRWHGWMGRSMRWDGRLLRAPLRFGKPHGCAPCFPHATKEESVVPPWRCRVLLHALRRLRNWGLLEDVVEDGLDDDDPFFLVKRLVVLFHMIATLFSLLKFRVATGS